MNGLVLWISGLATSDTHSASKGSAAFSDLVRECSDGARRGDGDTFFTIWPSHCSGLGSGEAVSTGTTFCGEGPVTAELAVASMLLVAIELEPGRAELYGRSTVCCLIGDSDRGGIVGCAREFELGAKTGGSDGLTATVAARSGGLVVDDVLVR